MKYLFTIPVFVACLLFFQPGSAPAWFSTTPENLTDACEVLARTLSSRIPEGKAVAVRPFLSAG